MKIEIIDDLLGYTYIGDIGRRDGTFYVVLKMVGLTSVPLNLKTSKNWSEAKEQVKFLLYVTRAGHRCSAGYSEYGLPEEMKMLEKEIPAMTRELIAMDIKLPQNN